MDVTRVPAGLSVAFFGKLIPYDVQIIVPLLHSEEVAAIVRPCIAKVVEYLRTADLDEADGDEMFIRFLKSVGGTSQTSVLFTGLFSILRAAIGSKVNTTTIVTDLKRMNIPSQAADDLGQAILRSRQQLETAALEHRIRFPKLDKLRWRVDVSIASGSLSRVMRPSILMQLILSDGRIKTFEVSQDQFNQLRFGVAKVLREMMTLDRHPISTLLNLSCHLTIIELSNQ